MNGYKYNGFDLVALISNPKTTISTIKFKVKAHDFTNCAISESPHMVSIFSDTTGNLNNSSGTDTKKYATFSTDGDYYVYSWDINNTYTENYLKIPIFIAPVDTKLESSMVIDDIQILIDDVKVPILKLGGFFTDGEQLTGDIDYILNYVNNLS